ncbi:MAG: purine-nucleoside phosphorylase [Vicinamibacterales bacterium]|jgi:purine-nucleoside phosphorylase
MRSSLVARLDEAAAFVRARAPLEPQVGVILGSGLGAFGDSLEGATALPYTEIPHFPASTVVGHGGSLVLGRCRGVPVAVMKGRVHFYEGYSLEQVVFPARVLGRLGVGTLVVTNAAGAVNKSYAPGELMVIEDHINLLGNPMLGPNEDTLGERFFDLSEAYDRGLRDAAGAACDASGVRSHRGVYLALTGPSFETPAEIRAFRTLGADAVGMSTVPEVIAARHMGIRVVGLSCITNMAAGVLDQKLDHREVLETGERVKEKLLAVLGRLVQAAVAR